MTVTRSQVWSWNNWRRWGWDRSTVSLLSRFASNCGDRNYLVRKYFNVYLPASAEEWVLEALQYLESDKSIIIFIMIVIVVLRIEISVSSITTTKQLLYEQSSEIQWLSVSNQPTTMILKIYLNVLLTCIWSWCVGRLFFSENYETIWCCTTAR